MKSMNEGIIVPCDKKELKELMQETRETIATNVIANKKGVSKFGIIDLWRMQKKHKTLGSSTRW